MIKAGKIFGSMSMLALALGLAACANQEGKFFSDQARGNTVVASQNAQTGTFTQENQQYLSQLEKNGAKVNRQGNQVTVWMPENTSFRQNSSVLNKNLRQQLNTVAMLLKTDPSLTAEVRGTTDSSSSSVSNSRLSQRRAETVISYLKHRGVDSDRLQTVAFSDQTTQQGFNQKAVQITFSFSPQESNSQSNQDNSDSNSANTDSQYSG